MNNAVHGAVGLGTSMYTDQRQVLRVQNLLLHGTTAIHGGSEIFMERYQSELLGRIGKNV